MNFGPERRGSRVTIGGQRTQGDEETSWGDRKREGMKPRPGPLTLVVQVLGGQCGPMAGAVILSLGAVETVAT